MGSYEMNENNAGQEVKQAEAVTDNKSDTLTPDVALTVLLPEQPSTTVENAILDDTTIKTKTKRAGEAVLALSKVEDKLFNPEHFDELFGQHGKDPEEREPFQILTARKKDVVTLLNVDWDENDLKERGISIPSWNRLTAFDRAVYMAIASLFFAGNKYLTSRMVYQLLCGNKKVSPTQEILALISRSIERMSVIRVTIDATAEVKAKCNIQAEYKDYMLNTRTVRAVINGIMLDCIQINTPPILYLYANAKNQIARLNIRMLDTPKVNSTQENIELKDYLLRRVSSMKNDKSKLGNVFRYETIYEYLRLETGKYSEQTLRNKKKDVRDTIKKILNVWIDLGIIKGFEEVSEGRTKAKVALKF